MRERGSDLRVASKMKIQENCKVRGLGESMALLFSPFTSPGRNSLCLLENYLVIANKDPSRKTHVGESRDNPIGRSQTRRKYHF